MQNKLNDHQLFILQLVCLDGGETKVFDVKKIPIVDTMRHLLDYKNMRTHFLIFLVEDNLHLVPKDLLEKANDRLAHEIYTLAKTLDDLDVLEKSEWVVNSIQRTEADINRLQLRKQAIRRHLPDSN